MVDWDDEDEMVADMVLLGIVGIQDPVRPEVRKGVWERKRERVSGNAHGGTLLHSKDVTLSTSMNGSTLSLYYQLIPWPLAPVFPDTV